MPFAHPFGRNARRVRATKGFSSEHFGVEALEHRLLLSGQAVITGSLWNDLDFDQARDAGEPALPGRTVYIDADGDSQFDAGELSTITDADGAYAFTGLAAGTYLVRQNLPTNWSDSVSTLASSDGTLVAIGGYRDVVLDSPRGLLYATTDHGTIERVDLKTKIKLTPFAVGTSLLGADITPDGRYLYVAEGQPGAQGVVYRVDLESGSSTSITYARDRGEGGAFDVAIGANGRGLVTARYNGSGWVPLRRLDVQANTLTRVSGDHSRVRQDTQIERSADRSLLFLTESNISSGPLFTYHPMTNTFGAGAETQSFLGGINSAVNKSGSLIAIEIGGVSIMTGGLKAVENLPGVSGGLAFDPTRNVVYALDTSAATSDAVVAFDTTTWKELFRFQVGENVTRGGSFGSDTLRVSDDGRLLMLGTPFGVRLFDLAAKFGTHAVTVTDTSVIAGIDFGSFALPTPTVSIGDVTIVEGSSGTRQALLTLTLSEASYRDVVVTYATVDGSASTLDLDYLVGSGRVTFAAGTTATTIAVTLRGDTKDELDESFFVNVLAADGATIGDRQGEVIVQNDDLGTRAKLSGLLWSDKNSNGVQEAGESPLAGWTVYIDQNNNGRYDSGELTDTTGADGRYTFVDLPAGEYTVAQIVPDGWLQTTHVGLASAGQPILLPAGTTSSPLYQARDLVFDSTRNQLIVTTATGTIERIDLNDMRLLDSWQVGVSLQGADITSDGKFLYVAEATRNVTQGFVRRIGLDNGSVTLLPYDLVRGEAGAFDIAIGANGQALVTTIYSGSGWTPVRLLNLAAGTFSTAERASSGLGAGPVLQRSADGSHILLLEANISSGPVHIYDAVANSFTAHLNTNSFITNYPAAANRDGSLYALGLNGLTIYGSALQVVRTISFGDATRGLAFDPVRDLLFRAGTSEITVFDTNTWTEVFRLPIGESLGSGKVPMTVSSDGQTLFLVTGAGVRVYHLVSDVQRITMTTGATVDNANFGNRFLAGNEAPSATDDDFSVAENGFIVANLLGNDSDPEDDPLSIVAVNGESASPGSEIGLAQGGFVLVDADGSFTFNPAGAFEDLAVGETRTVSFTYDVVDAFDGSDTAIVSITVEGRNDAPTAIADAFSAGETGLFQGSLLTNDVDVDGDMFSVSAVNGDTSSVGQAILLASGAQVTVNADGTFTYDPNGRFTRLRRGETAEDTFAYTIDDGAGGTATATVTLTIVGGGGEDDLIGYFDGTWRVGVSDGISFNSSAWADWSRFAPTVLKHGDFNGDGRVDVLGFSDGAWWIGISDGSSFVTSTLDAWSALVGKDVTQIAVGDVDADGDDDVLALARGLWWVGLSDGANFTTQLWAGWSDKPWQQVALVDLDADGNADLLANFKGAWWASLSTGNGFETATRWGAWSNTEWDAIGTFDANGDDRTDVYAFSHGTWHVGISDGSGFSFNVRTWKNADWADAVVGDFDGDGRDDVAARLAGSWWVGLSSVDGEAGLTSHWGVWKDVAWNDVAVGDFDGDGRDDIAGRLNSQWWVSRSTGVNFETSYWDSWDVQDWQAVAAANASDPAVSVATARSAVPTSEQEELALLWSSTDDEDLAAALLAI